MKEQTRLQLSDLHIPFEDPDLVKVWCRMLTDLQPDGIDIIGDLIDCYTLSRFDKNPRRKQDIQVEVDKATVLLGEIRRLAPNVDIRYLEGNHENRLERMLWGSAKALGPLRNLTIPKLMGLKDLEIKYYVPANPYRIGDLYFLHGDVTRKQNFSKSPGGRAAADVAKAIGASVLMGHTHQMGYSSFRTWERVLESYEIGCMTRFDLEYIVGVPPWQQGWSMTHFLPSGRHEVQFVRVIESGPKREVIFRGQVYATIGPAKKHFICREN
jgi:UDP-2,3-diacylglucosamine pyrophosphatase LpxH